jgi:putative acetyltransferase
MDPDQILLERRASSPSPEGLIIRASRPSDAEGIETLNNLPCYRFGTLRVPYQSLEEIRTFLESRPPGNLGIVAVLDDRIVGCAGLERFPGRRNHAGAIGMGVHDEYAGRGIGAALMRALLDTADKWLNLKRIELTVYVDNGPAIALYRRHGFEVEGTLRSYAFRNGSFADAYAMARVR